MAAPSTTNADRGLTEPITDRPLAARAECTLRRPSAPGPDAGRAGATIGAFSYQAPPGS